MTYRNKKFGETAKDAKIFQVGQYANFLFLARVEKKNGRKKCYD